MFAKLVQNEEFPIPAKRSSVWDVAQATHPGGDLSSRLRRTKMLLRLLFFLRHHRKVSAIFQHHPLKDIPLANPGIYEKIFRDYLCTGTSVADRVRLLGANYRFVKEVFDHSWIEPIYVQRNFTLCTFELPGEPKRVTARLGYDRRFEKEGELTLALFDEDGRRLYSLSFSFLATGGWRAAVIGCIIGPESLDRDDEDSPLVRTLTKATHGMRPQNLVLFLLQAICRRLGIGSLLAVGSATHVYGGCAKKRDRIKFDYDRFWEEVGGEPAGEEGYYLLPLQQARRAADQIRANKRALYARRYAFLDDLEDQIARSLAEPSHRPVRHPEPAPRLQPQRVVKAA